MVGRLRRIALIASMLCIAATPVLAQEAPKTPSPQDSLTEQTEKAFRQSIETILKALEKLVSSVPLYEAPEVLENGDIIIRRKRPEKKPPEEKSDGTSRT